MNPKQAHYLITIAECGSITAAAKKLYVSQPSLSQMLRQIEQEIGLPIFDRSVSPLRLSYAGEKCLQAAERILSANTELENQLREIKHDHSGRLRLGISVTRAAQVLPLVLPIFHAQYPHVTLELAESGSASLEDLLQQGKIDLALAALDTTSKGMTYELIEKEIVGILAGKGSRLTARYPSGTPVSLEEIKGETFVCLTPNHSVRLTQDKLFRKADIKPDILLETDSLEIARRVTVSTGACMLLPDIYAEEPLLRNDGGFYPLKDFENHRHFYACYRKDKFIPRYTKDFVSITTSILAQEHSRL